MFQPNDFQINVERCWKQEYDFESESEYWVVGAEK